MPYDLGSLRAPSGVTCGCRIRDSLRSLRRSGKTPPRRAYGVRSIPARLLLLFLVLAFNAGAVEAGRRRRPLAPTGAADSPDSDDDPDEPYAAPVAAGNPRRGRRGSGAGPVQPSPPMPAAPADFVAGSHVTGIPMVLPTGPGPPLHGSSADERHRESVRDMFSMELALKQLNGDSGRVLNNMQQACSGCGSVADARLVFAAGSRLAEHLDSAFNELKQLRHTLQRSRARWNLPPALAFEESRLRVPLARDIVPPALMPHPDILMPRCLPYHTPVWDALIWRFVNHIDPSGASQQANLLRNYPPYLHTHAAPLEPPVQAHTTLSSALQTLSLQPAAAATDTAVPPFIPAVSVSCGAPEEVDAAEGGMSEDDMLTGDFDEEDEDRFDYGEFHCYDGEGSESDFDGYASDAPGNASAAAAAPAL